MKRPYLTLGGGEIRHRGDDKSQHLGLFRQRSAGKDQKVAIAAIGCNIEE